MDENQPTQQPEIPQKPTNQQQPAETAVKAPSKIIPIIGIGAFIVVIIVGIMYFANSKPKISKQPESIVPSAAAPTQAPITKAPVVESLPVDDETALEDIDLGDLDSEFMEIEKDIDQL